MLRSVYPRLDLAHVRFYLGMPHLLALGPYQAITLPSPFGFRRVGIYVRRRSFRAHTVSGLGILVHEAFHALQIQEILGGWGIGLVRPFPILYLACAAANRFQYDDHPIETDAYEHAGRRASRFEQALSARAAGGRVADVHVAEAAAEQSIEGSGVEFWRKAWRSAGLGVLGRAGEALKRGWHRPALRPAVALGFAVVGPLAALGAVWLGVWLALWSVATAILWGLQLLVVGLAAGVSGVLFGAGTLLRFAGSRRREPR